MRTRRVVLCGGGTGGHTFPALAVGRRLREVLPSVRLSFIGTGRRVEREIMTRAEEEFFSLRIAGLRGRGWRTIPSLLLLPLALWKTVLLLAQLRPDLVVGVGGYSSGPVILLASLLGKPTIILEQNVRPGFTNRMLLPFVKRAVVSFQRSLPYMKGKGVFLGNPVREGFTSLPPKRGGEATTLLVFGGSQGSRFLNDTFIAALPLLSSAGGRLRFLHQTGPADEERVRAAYRRAGFPEALVSVFFTDMADFFGRADLVVCRAGATTVAELIAARKASLLVPFARAAGGHQMENARELERAGGAEVWPESRLTPEKLAERIHFYAAHPERLARLAGNLDALRTENAAGRIAGLCLELMGAGV